MTGLAQALALTPVDHGDGALAYAATIDPVYTVGPKVHGGSAQMISVNAAHAAHCRWAGLPNVPLADADGRTPVPVAATSTYLSSPDPAPVLLVVRLVKRGNTVSVVEVDLVQDGRVKVTTTVVLGRLDHGDPRRSVPRTLHDLPSEPPAGALFLAGSPMEQILHLGAVLDLALDPATFPAATGALGDPLIRGWVRPKSGIADLPFVTLVCDVSPPVVMNLGVFGWAPTVTLSTYLRRIPDAGRSAGGWLRFENSSAEVGLGMFESDHTVLDSTGVVVGQSRQLALIPAKTVDGPHRVE